MILSDTLSIDLIGYLAAAVVFLTFCMKTIVSLRIVAVASNIAFVAYALAADLVPILVLHGALLPLNLVRLFELRRQERMVADALKIRPGEDRFQWLVAFGQRRTIPDGAFLFRKDEPSDSLFVVLQGEIEIVEIGVRLGPGQLIGEMSLFSEDGRRTASAQARGEAVVSEITRRRVLDVFFDNPAFALRLVRLITSRLIDNWEGSRCLSAEGEQTRSVARGEDEAAQRLSG